MNTIARRSLSGLILAAGLLVASAPAYALQDGDVAAPTAKSTAEQPAAKPAEKPVKQVKIVAPAKPVTFKQKLAVYNRAKQDNDKLYCREDRMTGSHRKQMRCITYETKRLEEDAARYFFSTLVRGR